MTDLVDKNFLPTIKICEQLGKKYIQRIEKAKVIDYDLFTSPLIKG